MKKHLLTGLLFSSILAFGQNQVYQIADKDGTVYEDNTVKTFYVHGTFEDPIDAAKLPFVITNTSSEVIKLAGELVEMTNTDGQSAQFCIGGPSGNCFFPLFTGSFYPSNEGGQLGGNASWGYNDYFINLDATPGASYKVRFTQKDDAGNDIPNTNFTITYLYAGEMGVADLNKSVASVSPTVVKGYTQAVVKENATMQIYNAEGKLLKSSQVQAGTHKVDMSGFAPGIYVVSFKGTSGFTTSTKVVVK